ncbi:hypothetical protein [Methylocaldum sp. GT1TLB]|jgi:hypothetical protein|uniref:hypothetical protein n=1 Tax=Methylocaldum sp. GT1TLB TaxID=3438965 RepID=UPI003DA06D6F
MIDSTAAKKLRALVERYRLDVPAPVTGNWKRKSDGDLWASVIVQIAVVGSAASGTALNEVLSDKQAWYESLVTKAPKARSKDIHQKFREAGVRYSSSVIDECRKTAAAAYNFEVLKAHGGPRAYFTKIAAIPDEHWRIAVVSDELSYIKNKGARDLLIGLGMVARAVAFDSRLIKILEHIGVRLPKDLATNKPKYKVLERELLDKVCEPCGISGGHLDRILFNKYEDIVV